MGTLSFKFAPICAETGIQLTSVFKLNPAPLTNGVKPNANGKRGTSRANRPPPPSEQQRNPYAPRAADFLSNISNFNIIESTLRGSSVTSFQLHMAGN